MIQVMTQYTISPWLDLIIWSIGIVFILWLLRKVEFFSRRKPGLGKIIQKLIPLLDALGIIMITIWFGRMLFKDQSTYWTFFLGIVIILILWLVRFSLLDITAGMILRFENAFSAGEGIIINDESGIISKVRLRCLDIALDKGKMVSIPYSKLSSQSLVKPASGRPIKSHFFQVGLLKRESVQDLKSQLEFVIMNQPWSVLAYKPIIEPLEEKEDRMVFKVTVYALELEHLSEIERAVRSKFSTAA